MARLLGADREWRECRLANFSLFSRPPSGRFHVASFDDTKHIQTKDWGFLESACGVHIRVPLFDEHNIRLQPIFATGYSLRG